MPDARINEDVVDERDGSIGKVGHENNFNRYFYTCAPPWSLEEIERDIKTLEVEILGMVKEMMG